MGEPSVPRGFVHARTFDTRWGIGLAFIDIDDADDVERLRLQVWAPLAADGDYAKVTMAIGLNAEASDAAHDAMSAGNRQALVAMTQERFELAFATYGIAQTLDEAFAKAAGGAR